MGNKISYALNKCKMIFIVVLVLWIILSMVLIMPGSIAIVDSTTDNGKINTETLFSDYFNNAGSIFQNLGKIFSSKYISTFLKGECYLFVILLFCGGIGVVKTLPKHDYADIEHGSSDWATGEKYAILNRNKGILLAEKHYLPVDKRGNTNVLVVGRFRFW